MKFIYGLPPMADDKDCPIEDHSVLMKDYERIFRYGPVVSFVLLVVVALLWMRMGFDPLRPLFVVLNNPVDGFLVLVVMMFTTVLHEVVHLISYPMFWRDDKAGFGFAPKVFMPYAWYSGVLSRGRSIYCLLAPSIWITWFSLVGEYACHSLRADEWIPFISTFNAMSSGGDFLLTIMILFIVPRGAYMQGTAYGTRLKEPLSLPPSRSSA